MTFISLPIHLKLPVTLFGDRNISEVTSIVFGIWSTKDQFTSWRARCIPEKKKKKQLNKANLTWPIQNLKERVTYRAEKLYYLSWIQLFQILFPRIRFWWVITCITTLYRLMLKSWHQETAQSLVNMLSILWDNKLPQQKYGLLKLPEC